MPVEMHVNNAAGVPKKVKQIFVNNAAGQPIELKQVYVNNAAGVPKLVFDKSTPPPVESDILWTDDPQTITTTGTPTGNLTGIRLMATGISEKTSNNGSWGDNFIDWANPSNPVIGELTNFECSYNTFQGDALDLAFPTENDWYPIIQVLSMAYNAGEETGKSCSFNLVVRKFNQPSTQKSSFITLIKEVETL